MPKRALTNCGEEPDTARVRSYRDIPEDITYREREHHPICAWCKHFNEGSFIFNHPDMCEPSITAGWLGCVHRDGDVPCENKNGKGQCDGYSPSLATRVRQIARLLPFIPRIHEVTSQDSDGVIIEYKDSEGQVRVHSVD